LSICMTPMEVDIRSLQPAIRPAEDFPGGPGFDSRRAVSRQERRLPSRGLSRRPRGGAGDLRGGRSVATVGFALVPLVFLC
jgi:hypothetical protein